MRHLFLVTFLVLNFIIQTQAQTVEIGSYASPYDNEVYPIKIEKTKVSNRNIDGYNVIIHTPLLDNGDGYISLTSNEHKKLIINLHYIKEKFTEWRNIAIKNNVKEISKNFEKSINIEPFFRLNGKLYQAKSTYIDFYFGNIDTDFTVLGFSPELKSYHNEYITYNPIVVIFTNVNDIDNLLNEITIDKVKKGLNAPDVNELFKN